MWPVPAKPLIRGFVDLLKTLIEMKSEDDSNFIAARNTSASLAWTLALCALIGGTGRAPALDVTSMKAAATYSAARRGTALLINYTGREDGFRELSGQSFGPGDT
jgi:hypothetical protein